MLKNILLFVGLLVITSYRVNASNFTRVAWL